MFFFFDALSILLAAAVAVKCGKESLLVMWKVDENLVATPFEVLLGRCFPSKFIPTSDGGRMAFFNYGFADCFFKQTVHGSYVPNTFIALKIC